MGNSDDQTHPVGAFKPNPWGLYDIHGNVSEWVEDWLADYPAGSVVDPKGPQSGSHRVIRSGSWANRASTLRSARRRGLRLDEYGELVGFRLARSVSLDLWHFLKPETKKGGESLPTR
ncbi:MAG: SUMF1/EgtB/PvdO family nonheme iron enzyme [Desulfobacterales bacterium]